mmetsp:Transcript_70901/g.168197  ORF Transcript_70901/g.168197 Transcript_70901/m.168197 type:complete len:220 (+) Transcript_70901:179-838(+)
MVPLIVHAVVASHHQNRRPPPRLLVLLNGPLHQLDQRVHFALLPRHCRRVRAAEVSRVVQPEVVQHHQIPVVARELREDVPRHVVVHLLCVENEERSRPVGPFEPGREEAEPRLVAEHEHTAPRGHGARDDVVLAHLRRVQVRRNVEEPGDGPCDHGLEPRQGHGRRLRSRGERKDLPAGELRVDVREPACLLVDEVRAHCVDNHEYHPCLRSLPQVRI